MRTARAIVALHTDKPRSHAALHRAEAALTNLAHTPPTDRIRFVGYATPDEAANVTGRCGVYEADYPDRT